MYPKSLEWEGIQQASVYCRSHCADYSWDWGSTSSTHQMSFRGCSICLLVPSLPYPDTFPGKLRLPGAVADECGAVTAPCGWFLPWVATDFLVSTHVQMVPTSRRTPSPDRYWKIKTQSKIYCSLFKVKCLNAMKPFQYKRRERSYQK